MIRRVLPTNVRSFVTFSGNSATALSVFQNSCYQKVDFKINENSPVNEAVTRFTVFNIGCLAVTDATDKVVGVCSERDYIMKVAAHGLCPAETKVKDICTYRPMIVAKSSDSLQNCMNKMLVKDIRHLVLLDDKKEKCLGMISIKDLIKEIMKDNQDSITRLSDFNLGKGAYFGSE
jgi:predicted transcriptional regulator